MRLDLLLHGRTPRSRRLLAAYPTLTAAERHAIAKREYQQRNRERLNAARRKPKEA